jgi:transposase
VDIKLLKRIDLNLPMTIEGCHELILKQQALIESFIGRIEKLEEQTRKNSKNSNKPPSSDGLKKRPAFARETGKKRGGQNGHKGNKLQLVEKEEEIDEREVLYPDASNCRGCGSVLDKSKALLSEIRQEFDLPEPKLLVREFQKMEIGCSCCGAKHYGMFPEHIKATTQYGSGVRSLTVLLNNGFALPVKKVQSLFVDLFGYQINESTIVNNSILCYNGLEPTEIVIKEKLTNCENGKSVTENVNVGHSDETGVRVAGKLHWLHVFSSALYTFFFVHEKRGKEALNDPQSILPKYSGWVVHDCWASYFSFEGVKHALCGAHILRELYALDDKGTIWAKWFRRYLLTLLHLIKQNNGCLTKSQQQKALLLYEKICAYANEIEPLPQKKESGRGRPKATKGRNLLNRLIKHQDGILAFAFHSEVPFTNNLAERDLRPIKTKQKVAGCFRTLEGAQRHARIFGFISTVRKNELNIFNELKNLFDNKKTAFS